MDFLFFPLFVSLVKTAVNTHTHTHTQGDLNFPDTPRVFAWVGDSLIVCIKKDLYHTTVSHVMSCDVM